MPESRGFVALVKSRKKKQRRRYGKTTESRTESSRFRLTASANNAPCLPFSLSALVSLPPSSFSFTPRTTYNLSKIVSSWRISLLERPSFAKLSPTQSRQILLTFLRLHLNATSRHALFPRMRSSSLCFFQLTNSTLRSLPSFSFHPSPFPIFFSSFNRTVLSVPAATRYNPTKYANVTSHRATDDLWQSMFRVRPV